MSIPDQDKKGAVVDDMAADSGDDAKDLNAENTPEPDNDFPAGMTDTIIDDDEDKPYTPDTENVWIRGSYLGKIDMAQHAPLYSCRDDFYKGAWQALLGIGGTVFLRTGVKSDDFLEDGDVVIELSQQLNLGLLLDWTRRGHILLQDGQCVNVIDVESRPGKVLLSIETGKERDDDNDD